MCVSVELPVVLFFLHPARTHASGSHHAIWVLPVRPRLYPQQFYQNTLIEVIEGLETLFIFVRNLLQNPGDHRFANIASSNLHFQERLGCLIGAKECMQAIGFDPDHNGWNYKFDYKAFANDRTSCFVSPSPSSSSPCFCNGHFLFRRTAPSFWFCVFVSDSHALTQRVGRT